jgi:hypothetical protein
MPSGADSGGHQDTSLPANDLLMSNLDDLFTKRRLLRCRSRNLCGSVGPLVLEPHSHMGLGGVVLDQLHTLIDAFAR